MTSIARPVAKRSAWRVGGGSISPREAEAFAQAATARMAGEAVDAGRHPPAVEVKGATPAELKVGRESDGERLAQCVVDAGVAIPWIRKG